MIPKRLLPHTVTFKNQTGAGPSGAVYGPVQTIRARVQYRNRVVRDSTGTEVVSASTIYCQPTNAPTLAAKVTMPDGVVRTVIARADNVGVRATDMITLDVK